MPCALRLRAHVLTMKKRFLSAVLILLLMMLLLPGACADYIYPAPEPVALGQPFDHLVATVAAGASVTGNLPEGLRLETEAQGGEANVYLRGSVAAAGYYACIINIDNATFTCPVTVTPEQPLVAVSPSLRCFPGEAVQVSISATGPEGGQLSYQWYQSLTAADQGSPVGGAIDASLMAPTDQLGTLYYRCLVSADVAGLSSSTLSDPISVTVEELSVSALFVETLPLRTEYLTGDTLETEGLTIRAQLDNDESRILSEGFGVYPTRLDQPGTQEIEVSYQGKTCVFSVSVQQAEENIAGIGVLTLPKKTSYVVGDTLDTAGLSIRVYTSDGYRDVSEGLECSPASFDTAGDQTVTVRYGDRECTFTVLVSQEAVPAGLSVARLPDKIQYAVGESLDSTGLVIRQISSSNESTDIYSGFTCSPTEFSAAGHQEITVTYGDLSCRFNVTVTQAAASPSPSPTPSPSPAPQPTAAPSPTAVPQPAATAAHTASPSASARSNGSARTFFVVVMVASLLALAALGGYVFVMNRGGLDQARQTIKDLFDRSRKR